MGNQLLLFAMLSVKDFRRNLSDYNVADYNVADDFMTDSIRMNCYLRKKQLY